MWKTGKQFKIVCKYLCYTFDCIVCVCIFQWQHTHKTTQQNQSVYTFIIWARTYWLNDDDDEKKKQQLHLWTELNWDEWENFSARHSQKTHIPTHTHTHSAIKSSTGLACASVRTRDKLFPGFGLVYRMYMRVFCFHFYFGWKLKWLVELLLPAEFFFLELWVRIINLMFI